MGSLHTLRDKAQIGLVAQNSILNLSREALPASGMVVAKITARSVHPSPGELLGLRISMASDLSPACDGSTDVFCDGGSYNDYFLEVIDRMGADSFTPDAGVMISKTKLDSFDGRYQWTIDANPQDIRLLDFYRPGTNEPVYITLGDYRQLADALFHAGTRSGSEFEFVDEANNLHFYIIDVVRDKTGVLSYTVAVKSASGGAGKSKHGVAVSLLTLGTRPTPKGVSCSFKIRNTGHYSPSSPAGNATQLQDVSAYLKSDVYRLKASVVGNGWSVVLPNELVAVPFGEERTVKVAVKNEGFWAAPLGVVKLSVVSESGGKGAEGFCVVSRW